MTLSSNVTPSAVSSPDNSKLTVDAHCTHDSHNAHGSYESDNNWLLPLSAIALLGTGFFVAKPLLESILQVPKLQAPIQTNASRQNIRIVEIPSSSSSLGFDPSQVAPPATFHPLSTTNSATTSSQHTIAVPNSTDSSGSTRVNLNEATSSLSTASAKQVRLIPPNVPQPGLVVASPTPLAIPTIPAPSTASLSTAPAAPPNTSALRRAVRNLAQAIPRQSTPPQTIGRIAGGYASQSPSLPEEDAFIASLYNSDTVPSGVTGDVIAQQPQPQQPQHLHLQQPQPQVQPDLGPLPLLQPSPSRPQPEIIVTPGIDVVPLSPVAPPERTLPEISGVQESPSPDVVSGSSGNTASPEDESTISIVSPQAIAPTLTPELEALVPDLAPELDDAISATSLPQRPSIPDEIALNQFNVTGSTVFSPEELAAVAQQAVRASMGEDVNAGAETGTTETGEDASDRPFDGTEMVSIAQLIQASDRITQRYVDAGYISSGAIIPEDGIQPDGTVNIQIIEGELEAINVARSPERRESLLNHVFLPLGHLAPVSALSEWLFPEVHRHRLLITGNRPLGLDYVRRRLARAGSSPLNLNRLLGGVQLLQVDPLIDTVSTEIREGTDTGTNILDVDVIEAPTTSAHISVDNSRSPSVGSIQQRASLSQANFLGFGDRLALGANQTEGSDGWDISYAIPINRRNGTFSFAHSNSSSEVIEEPFGVLDIQSESRSYEFTLRQPVVQTPTEELALSLTASRRETESEFLASLTGTAEPFPSTGADANGETRISALRFAQDWTRQASRQVFSLRSEFSLGLDALNSTVNPIRPDSRFFSWRGQGQWVRQIGSDRLFLLRGDLQLADGPLVPGEQFGLGGQSTIRGYRQDSLLTDNGWLASAEFRIPVLSVPTVDGVLQVAPFVEVGQGWNPKESDPPNNTLASAGLGLLWRMGDRFSSRLDWGIPLTSITSSGSSFQEDGFHFSLQFSPF